MPALNAPARVAVVGDALIDVLRDSEASREFPGGAALNVAVGLAVLGVPTTLMAPLFGRSSMSTGCS
ncbi:PfkB family carbohydrate kinase [Cryobacterium sp. Y62]|uniref:PfkB family carbohydrate kinase n=1 Tax=unclassified Cryobacterium TaxID=2649013 RepID=UPI0034CFE000